MGLKHWAPLVFAAVFLFFSVLGLGMYRFFQVSGITAGFLATGLVVYLVWCCLECVVSTRERFLKATSQDATTCELYGFAQCLVVLSALILTGQWHWPIWIHGLGLMLLILGMVTRLCAIATLGRFYSRRVRLLSKHQVICNGPYRWVRHPAYTGALLGHLGFSMVFQSWFAVALLFGFMLPMVIRRILVEEPVLYEIPEYEEYARNKKRLVPLLW